MNFSYPGDNQKPVCLAGLEEMNQRQSLIFPGALFQKLIGRSLSIFDFHMASRKETREQ